MSDSRDDLAAIIHSATCPYEDCHESATTDDYNGADVILARWRLVPVEEQFRAADELTQHDQAAGHYADQAEERLVNANEDDAPSSSESVYGFRTDQHEPHEG